MMKLAPFFTKAVIFIFVLWRSEGYEAQTQVKQLWGMTNAGGQYGLGTIFKTDSSGNNHNVQYSFVTQNESDIGANPIFTQLIEASDGKLYGMTANGGANYSGVLFQYDLAALTYTKRIDFGDTTKGAYPNGSLMQASDGKLYGMTYQGGTNNMGVLFQFDPITSIYVKKLDFKDTTKGANPMGSLIQASDGKLYGMTTVGGTHNMGVLFQFDPITSVYVKKLDFKDTTKGSYPNGSLIQASDGKLYGMTSQGGTNNKGVIFQYDPVTATYTKNLDFAGATNGVGPIGSLIQASDGKFYGMTSGGGIYGWGVLFQYDPVTSAYTKKLDFAGTANGGSPYGSLMQAGDGKLYGMTLHGGANDLGVLFQYDPVTSAYTKKLDFAGATNGSSPRSSLMQASDGKLYGMTEYGGAYSYGVLFQFDPSTSSYSKKFDFEGVTTGTGSTFGESPLGSLMQASDGQLYGMTSLGGVNNMGALFQYNSIASSYTKKYDFADGFFPVGSLIQTINGDLFGMTPSGGYYGAGALFKYIPSFSYFFGYFSFDYLFGYNPNGSLMQASDGKLYGMTKSGSGLNYLGNLFQYDPVNYTYIEKFDFSGLADGANPSGSLIQASDGKFYGMTENGGTSDKGVLFQYDPSTSTYAKKLDFNGVTKGANPQGSLMQASDGKFYGMTRFGGTNNMGVLFQYDPVTSIYTKKLDFKDTTKGAYPLGELMQASNGKLYGMTKYGGANNKGVLFQYDPATSAYTKKLDFSGINGSYPTTHLIEVAVNSVGINSLKKELALKLYPNPAHDLLTLELLTENQKNATIIIENMFGQVIYETQINTSIHQIYTENYTQGIYLVKVKTNDGAITKKIIVN